MEIKFRCWDKINKKMKQIGKIEISKDGYTTPLLIVEVRQPIIKHIYTHRYYRCYDLPNTFTSDYINYLCNLALTD